MSDEEELQVWEDELIEVVPYDQRKNKDLVYVAAKKDLVKVNKYGYVPDLEWAVKNNTRHAFYSVAVMKDKVLNKIDEKKGATPLHLVAQGHSKSLFEYVLQRVDTDSILMRMKSGYWTAGDTVIHLVVRYGSIDMFRSLVKIKSDLMSELANMVGYSGSLPIHRAILRGNQEVIDVLMTYTSQASIIKSRVRDEADTILDSRALKPGCTMNRGSNELCLEDSAMLVGNDEIVRALLSNGHVCKQIIRDSPGLLHTVARSSYMAFKPIYDAFLAAGHCLIKTAKLGTTFFTLMIQLLNSDCVIELMCDPDFNARLLTHPDRYGNTPLHWAANGGLHDVCNKLYPTYKKAGLLLAINNAGRTVLAQAATKNTWKGDKVPHVNYVATIKSLTRNPTIGRKLISMDDNNGYSPLYLALTYEINDTCAGADICGALYDLMSPKQVCRRYTSNKYTILHLACWRKKPDLIDVFLKDRVKSRELPSIKDSEGETPLQGTKKGLPEIHKYLIKVLMSFKQ